MLRRNQRVWAILAALSITGCQSPTEADEAIAYDEIVDVSATPDPVVADADTGGRTYRVVRGNNQPDDILAYDWHAIFSTTLVFNSKAADKDVEVPFPVRITSTTVAIRQATGGIVTPPTGGEAEHYEFITLSASGNQAVGVGSPVSIAFEVWYDLPNLRKEAVITVTFAFQDDDGATFQKTEDFKVAP